MGWSIGHDSRWGKFGRDVGYGVPAVCDHPGCDHAIDRGLSYVCGSSPYGGDHGCGLYFCGSHLHFEDRDDECPQLCERCAAGAEPFEPKPDAAEWVAWKLTDESWEPWRLENPEAVAALREQKATLAGASGQDGLRAPSAQTSGQANGPNQTPLNPQHSQGG